MTDPDPAVSVHDLAAAELDDVEPVWNALREHHLAVGPEWLPAAHPRNVSWQLRRGQYESWLASDEGFVLVARRGQAVVGYAFVHLRNGSPTWQMAERAGEVETLAVLLAERGRGTGRRLLDAVYERLRNVGAREVSLHVLASNDGAARFYEREGFEPFAVWMTRDVPDRP